ncbi:sarcosine oxidase subunit gamma [Rhodoligotrophos defluvii]|uniref:sarcosine oxidase subunit gamma n=1 Tax=Rhodoligotrophos defluvii TaxID=2561934 RepID=UPI001484E569|nr:sarcosine oxidase subunit gamma family protein [Rhodoligotrophos defluvii]
MAEILSALDGHVKAGRHGANVDEPGVVLSEGRGLVTVQLTAWPDTASAVAVKAGQVAQTAMPPSMRIGISGQTTVLQVGPERWWFVVPASSDLRQRLEAAFSAEEAVVTDLSHARTIVRITGPKARDLLARVVPIDLHPAVFPRDSIAQTIMHGVGVLLHFSGSASDGDIFDLHIPGTFALSHWEWLVHQAEGLGLEIRA